MTTSVEDPTWTERLVELLLAGERAARQRAAEQHDEPALVSATVAVPEIDALTVFDRAAGEQRALWEQPNRSTSIVAIGSAHELTADGEARFSSVDEAWQRLMTSAIVAGAESAPHNPIAIGGFAFDPLRASSAHWQPFGQGSLTVPKYMLTSAEGESWLTVNMIARPGGDSTSEPAAVVSEVRRLLATLAGDGTAQNDKVPPGTLEEDRHATRWRDTAASAIDEIARGTIRKVVLAREAHARSTGPLSPGAILRRLRSDYGSSTLFAFAKGRSCFLGATPERLVRVDGSNVSTDCLAGSIARGATDAEDASLGQRLLDDPKERLEHALVVDAVREALRPLCSRLDVPDEPGLLRTQSVQHLHTPAEGTLENGAGVLGLVARLHPTPAAGGLPREAALALIRKSEHFDRGWYAGPVGWIDRNGAGEFAVAIRSMLLDGDRATLFAGCGIVAGSDPQREYEESSLKMRPMLWALNAQPS